MESDSRITFDPANFIPWIEPCAARLVETGPILARDLVHRTLLHLPRENPSAVTPQSIEAETRRLARRAQQECAPFAGRIPPNNPVSLDSLDFGEVDIEPANTIVRCFHYIGSSRPLAAALGAYRPPNVRTLSELPVILLGLSDFDLGNIAGACPSLNRGSVIVLSRVYSFASAPRNALSRGLRQVRAWLRIHRPSVRWIVTYVNPNLGFRAASYRADNWQLLGQEPFMPSYDRTGDYITPRGVATTREANEHPGLQPGDSAWALKPLQVFIRGVDGTRWEHQPVQFTEWSNAALP
jgi:hypothetical protein